MWAADGLADHEEAEYAGDRASSRCCASHRARARPAKPSGQREPDDGELGREDRGHPRRDANRAQAGLDRSDRTVVVRRARDRTTRRIRISSQPTVTISATPPTATSAPSGACGTQARATNTPHENVATAIQLGSALRRTPNHHTIASR